MQPRTTIFRMGMAVTVHDNTGKPLIAVNGLPQVLTQIYIIGEIQGITAVILTVVRDFLGKQASSSAEETVTTLLAVSTGVA